MKSTGVDLEELVACGHLLADSRGLPRAPEGALREMFTEVLARKQFVEGARDGLVTREEARQGVLEHLRTFLCDVSGTSPNEGWRDDEVLSRRVEEALFGQSSVA